MTQRLSDAYKAPALDQRITAKVLELVTKHFGKDETAIKGKARDTEVVKARHVACWLLYRYAGSNYNRIGQLMNRNHAAVMHGVEQVSFAIKTESYVHEDVKALQKQLEDWKNQPFVVQNRRLSNYTMKSLLEQKVNKHLTAA